jgi:xanthine permease XanP
MTICNRNKVILNIVEESLLEQIENPIPATGDLIYGLNDNPPFHEGLFVAIQHVMAIFVPIVTPP